MRKCVIYQPREGEGMKTLGNIFYYIISSFLFCVVKNWIFFSKKTDCMMKILDDDHIHRHNQIKWVVMAVVQEYKRSTIHKECF
jgi:hypothetical protein